PSEPTPSIHYSSRHPRSLPSFPTRRSSDLVMLDILVHDTDLLRFLLQAEPRRIYTSASQAGLGRGEVEDSAMSVIEFDGGVLAQDRKSTRLNSSHRTISYAVFCLKKKNKNT